MSLSPTKEEPTAAATGGGGHGGVKRPVVAVHNPLHHHHGHPPPHYHHPTSPPRRNLVPTVVVPITTTRPVVASSSSPFNSSAPRMRSYSLGTVPVGMDTSGTTLNHPVSPPFSWAARSLPHSPSTMTSEQYSAPSFLRQQPQEEEEGGLTTLLMPPPEPSESRRAMLAAVAKERQRAEEMEAAENTIEDAHALRAILKAERKRMAKIAGDLAALQTLAVQWQLEAEVNEEGRINSLWRQMDTLQQEKGRIIVELEQEEEMVSVYCKHFFDFVRFYFCCRVTSCSHATWFSLEFCYLSCIHQNITLSLFDYILRVVDEYITKKAR
jgi:hypothetical protein